MGNVDVKTLLSWLFIIAVFSALIGSFKSPEFFIINDENRRMVEFPSFEVRRDFEEYFGQIDGFANDHFPLRDRFVLGYRWMVNSVADQVNANKAFRGRDGWLFLGNDYDRNVEKLEGRLIPEPERSALLNRITMLAHWFQQQGANVIFVLGPAKSSIYREKLPAIIKPSPVRHVAAFLEKLRDNGVHVVDPTAALLVRKHMDIVYWKDDTHWNQIGSWVAFEETVNAMGVRDCPVPQFELADPVKGGLINIGLFEMPSGNRNDNFRVVWSWPAVLSEQIVEDIEILEERNKTVASENLNPVRNEVVFIVGDSFRRGMRPFFSMCFSRALSMHIHRNSNEKLQAAWENMQIKPSHVIIVVTERTF